MTQLPYQRSWADKLQALQLKREVAGTSRIEGAEFTEKELKRAMRESPEELETRSQKQAAAAKSTYQWIAGLKNDRPVDVPLILEGVREGLLVLEPLPMFIAIETLVAARDGR